MEVEIFDLGSTTGGFKRRLNGIDRLPLDENT